MSTALPIPGPVWMKFGPGDNSKGPVAIRDLSGSPRRLPACGSRSPSPASLATRFEVCKPSIDHPTTRWENISRRTAQEAFHMRIGYSLMSVTQRALGSVWLNLRSTTSVAGVAGCTDLGRSLPESPRMPATSRSPRRRLWPTPPVPSVGPGRRLAATRSFPCTEMTARR
jgi:hypothetical protein